MVLPSCMLRDVTAGNEITSEHLCMIKLSKINVSYHVDLNKGKAAKKLDFLASSQSNGHPFQT